MVRNPRRPRGVALLMVLIVVGICTVLSLAMMSSSSVQAMIGDNLARASRADFLAESGLNYAIYQLKKTAASDDWFQGTTLSPGDGLPGHCVVTVQRLQKSAADKAAQYPQKPASELATAQEYLIRSDVTMTDGSGGVVARSSASARVLAWTELRIEQAVIAPGTLTLNQASPSLVVLSSVAVPKLNLSFQNTVSPGFAYVDQLTPLSAIPGSRQRPYAQAKAHITTPANVRTFETYTYGDGKTYSAAAVPHVGGVLKNFISTSGSASNPANVYRHVGSLVLDGGVHIRGTLVVENGNLVLNGTSSFLDLLGLGANNVIDASSSHSRGFPAIVVKNGSIVYNPVPPSGKILVAKGVVWVSGNLGFTSQGIGSEIIINGALELPTATSGIVTRGQIRITHDSATTNVPMLDKSLESFIYPLEWNSGG